MKRIWIINSIVVLFVLSFYGGKIRPPKDDGAKVSAFAKLPVKYDGRVKPIDTLARNLLTILSGKQSIRFEGKKISASEWFLDSVSGCSNAYNYPVFRIENRDLLANLTLKENKHFRYSLNELRSVFLKLDEISKATWQKQADKRDAFDLQVLKLTDNMHRYQSFIDSFEDPSTVPREQFMYVAKTYMEMENRALPLLIPPQGRIARWRPLMVAQLGNHPVFLEMRGQNPDQLAQEMANMLAARQRNNSKEFNRALVSYKRLLKTTADISLRKISFEVFYNTLSAFINSAQLYLLVFLLSCFGWMLRKDTVLTAALTLMCAAFIPHTFAIIARIFLSGYPPVTNLYSSAIFIGWGAVFLGIILEFMYRKKMPGVGNLVGSIAGFITLLIGHLLAGESGSDTMEKMSAILDTRFWLTTHVITMAMGYTASLVAGVIGYFYIVAGLFSKRIDAITRDNMYRMMYGITCFALLFNFLGTVLGGLWADDSWGRFWGWDPKENGALLLLTWSAVMLHAKYGRMIGPRGFANMAVFGNIVTAWSWFGVNQLGVGLHSYGFTQSTTFWVIIFVFTQATVCFAAFIPERYWRSFKEERAKQSLPTNS